MKKSNSIKTLSKRTLAIFVSVMMCMGILQTEAFAAVTVEAAPNCNQTAHTHTAECYTTEEIPTLICGKQEKHTHDVTCYTSYRELICDRPEAVEHSHTDACYETIEQEKQELICEEEHEHTDGCYVTTTVTVKSETLTCGMDEVSAEQAHTHNTDCYQTVKSEEPTCGMTEETVVHEHTEACYGEPTQVTTLTCTTPEHQHTEECYQGELDNAFYLDLYNSLNTESEDKDVILILNGKTLDMNKYSGYNIRVDGNDRTLTILDGTVAGGTILGADRNSDGTGDYRVITVVHGGSLTLTGNTVITGGGSSGGAGVYVGSGSSFTMTGGTITENNAAGTNNGGGVLVDGAGATFNMYGGTISNNSTASGDGGGVAVSGGTFNMYGGTISNNETDLTHWTDIGKWTEEPLGQGGGVYVNDGGSFNLYNGTISGNKAGEGGGVFVDGTYTDSKNKGHEAANFTMTGGTVDGNTAQLGEGGGIYIQGIGTITNGNITNNKTHTEKDLGGGGIYIESNGGKLNLKNAIVTGNYAQGLGGGFAACVHGQTVVYVKNGALIYGNTNDGNAITGGHNTPSCKPGETNGTTIDGHDLWENNDVFKAAAKDIFAASANDNNQGGGVMVSNMALGGGDANWTGFVFAYEENADGTVTLKLNEDGTPVFLPVEMDNDGSVVVSKRLLAMTANPSQETVEAAMAAVAALNEGVVIISGNSSDTHGGGIANNGLLVIGDGAMIDTEGSGVDLKKDYTNTETEEKIEMEGGEFQFAVTPTDYPEEIIRKPEVNIQTNAADGSVSFSFPEGTFTKEGTYKFLVQEVIPKEALPDENGRYYTEDENGNRTYYDNSLYEIEIVVTQTKAEETQIGEETVTMITLEVGTPVIYKVVVDENGVAHRVQKQVPVLDTDGNPVLDEDGNPTFEPAVDEDGNPVYETVDGITFDNTYTPAEEPGDDDDDDDDDDDIIPGDDDDDDDDDIPSGGDDDDDDDDIIPGDDDDDDDDIIPGDDDDDDDVPPPPETPDEPETPDVPEEEIPEEPSTPLTETPEEEPEEELIDEPIPTTNVPEEKEPEEEPEEELELPEDDIPLSDVPVTGDASGLWYTALGLSAAGLMVLRLLGKKREEEQA